MMDDVPVDTAVTVTFSECMDRVAAQSALSLNGGDASVEGTFSWSNHTMTFQPNGELSVLTTYQVKLSTGAKDTSGQPLAEEFTCSFTTSTAIPAAPRVHGNKPRRVCRPMSRWMFPSR